MAVDKIQVYFKLFNNIKDEHEAEQFAKIELEALFGRVEPIQNFADVIVDEPLSFFTSADIRLQDMMLHEVPYGKIQGYKGTICEIVNLTPLIRRLAYTREIFVAMRTDKSPQDLKEKIFPDTFHGKNIEFFQKSGHLVFRAITNQYFLEKSQYISKLSRNEEEIDNNMRILFKHLFDNIYRIPASVSMKVGKRLEDYFAKREEPSLYLTHYAHPYKGKFHPKMARALLNYTCSQEEQDTLVCDNFAGSGTLLLEATLMGINSCGVEINPLSVLMANVKCQSLLISPEKLKAEIDIYLEQVEKGIQIYKHHLSGQKTIIPSDIDISFVDIVEKKFDIPKKVMEQFEKKGGIDIDKVNVCYELAKRILKREEEKKHLERIFNFILLAISGSISDVGRRTHADFISALKKRLNVLYLRIYLFHKLNEVLKINIGTGEAFEGDTRDMKGLIGDNKVDAIVNSPPYSTALDYIDFDRPQLTILDLAGSLDELGEKMIGIPRQSFYPNYLLTEIEEEKEDFSVLCTYAKEIIRTLIDNGRKDAGLRTYKFYVDMYKTLKEMHRILKPQAKSAIIIGNNNYKINEDYIEIKNDQVLWELGEKIGFEIDTVITRELEKTSSGNIRYESVVVLQKP